MTPDVIYLAFAAAGAIIGWLLKHASAVQVPPALAQALAEWVARKEQALAHGQLAEMVDHLRAGLPIAPAAIPPAAPPPRAVPTVAPVSP